MNDATREILDNISPAGRGLFYVLMAASIIGLAVQLWWRSRLWVQGQPGGIERRWRVICRRLLVHVLAQKRVRNKSLGAVLHLFLFSGFVVLTIGTTLLAIAHYGPFKFHRGWYYVLFELAMDAFGIAFVIGCVLALYRRALARPASLGHRRSDWALLSLLLALGVSGFLIEALRLRYSQVQPQIEVWSPVGWAINRGLLQALPIAAAKDWHLAVWWLHAVMVAAFFLTLPQTRLLHLFTAPLTIALRPSRHPGSLVPLDVAEIERTGRIGVSDLTHFTRQQLLSLDACMECGRCQDACPAFASTKPLSPESLVLDLRRLMASPAAARCGEMIKPETLWACTMCNACVYECPVLIGHVDLISDLRRNLVGEGRIAGPPAAAMRHLGSQFNPYGRPHADRFAWADGLDVPTVERRPDFEYLLWVGCSASFDPRSQKVARATVELLKRAEVSFAVLGPQERCTGDVARRLGDELLFQELARANISMLDRHNVRKIVTPCPHCLNTLKNEYPQFGGRYEVLHHSQLLADVFEGVALQQPSATYGEMTLHDPCYLARVNGETAAPRLIIAGASPGGSVREMARNREKTFCCGAGGGRAWIDEPPAQRVSRIRAQEAIATGARTVVTACPFCLNMMTDGVASAPGGETLKVVDVAEVLLDRTTGL